jgi:DNA-binding transcriptional MerR regulator
MSNSKVLENYSFGQVVSLSGVKARTLDHWAATGFLAPSIKEAVGTGTRRVYSFSDVVAARVAVDLKFAGASLQGLRRVVKELRKMDFTEPLAEARLIVSGKDIYLRDNQYLISMLTKPGQTHFPFTVLDLEATVKTLRREAERLEAPRNARAKVVYRQAHIRWR